MTFVAKMNDSFHPLDVKRLLYLLEESYKMKAYDEKDDLSLLRGHIASFFVPPTEADCLVQLFFNPIIRFLLPEIITYWPYFITLPLDSVSSSTALFKDATGSTPTSWLSSYILYRVNKKVQKGGWLTRMPEIIQQNSDFTTINYLVGLISCETGMRKLISETFNTLPLSCIPGGLEMLHFMNGINENFANVFQIEAIHCKEVGAMNFGGKGHEIILLQNVFGLNCFVVWNLSLSHNEQKPSNENAPFILNLNHLKNYSYDNKQFNLIFQQKEYRNGVPIAVLGTELEYCREVSIDVKVYEGNSVEIFHSILSRALKKASTRIFSTVSKNSESIQPSHLQVAASSSNTLTTPSGPHNVLQSNGMCESFSESPITSSQAPKYVKCEKISATEDSSMVRAPRKRSVNVCETQIKSKPSSVLTDMTEVGIDTATYFATNFSKNHHPRQNKEKGHIELSSDDIDESSQFSSNDSSRQNDTTMTTAVQIGPKRALDEPELNTMLYESIRGFGDNLISKIREREKSLLEAFKQFETDYIKNITMLNEEKNELDKKYAQIKRRARSENDRVIATFERKIKEMNKEF